MKHKLNNILFLLIAGMLTMMSSCSKDDLGTPTLSSISPGTGPGGMLVTLQGSNLSSIRTIVFDGNNAPAGFNPNFNTDDAILFRVPDTASGGAQNIILTNIDGSILTVPFNVVAFPNVKTSSNYDFQAGDQISFTGINLEGVDAVKFEATNEPIEIVSKTSKSLIVKMPATSLTRSKLVISNSSGTTTTTDEYINIDQAFQIFTDDYQNGFADGSWGDAGMRTESEHKTGIASASKKYAQGNWHLINFVRWGNPVEKNTEWKFLVAWVKGGSLDYDLYFGSDKSEGGFGSFNEGNKITVKANVWNYYKIPMDKLDFWKGGGGFEQFGIRIQGPDAQDETFYFDVVMFVK